MYYIASLTLGNSIPQNEVEWHQNSTGKANSNITYTSDKLVDITYGEQALNGRLAEYASRHSEVSLIEIRQLTHNLPSLSELVVKERGAE